MRGGEIQLAVSANRRRGGGESKRRRHGEREIGLSRKLADISNSVSEVGHFTTNG